MDEAILRGTENAEFYTEERCYITELSNSPADPDISIARARVEPGVTTCWHRLVGTAERYVVVAGAAVARRD